MAATEEEKQEIMRRAMQRDSLCLSAAEQFIRDHDLTGEWIKYRESVSNSEQNKTGLCLTSHKCLYDGCLNSRVWDGACSDHQRENGFEDEGTMDCWTYDVEEKCTMDCVKYTNKYGYDFTEPPHKPNGICLYCKKHFNEHVKDGDIDFHFCPDDQEEV